MDYDELCAPLDRKRSGAIEGAIAATTQIRGEENFPRRHDILLCKIAWICSVVKVEPGWFDEAGLLRRKC